ncbi:hypothetical protein [Listeria booriae]|uniref:hypothetical protein n=1 Tax=Listeria booriae TaxID=1552123 RepID=UPI0016273613|nr:hypothetical protein [Listeria booriae]MBC1246848.1 hypothetical protein [Listeria booriae]
MRNKKGFWLILALVIVIFVAGIVVFKLLATQENAKQIQNLDITNSKAFLYSSTTAEKFITTGSFYTISKQNKVDRALGTKGLELGRILLADTGVVINDEKYRYSVTDKAIKKTKRQTSEFTGDLVGHTNGYQVELYNSGYDGDGVYTSNLYMSKDGKELLKTLPYFIIGSGLHDGKLYVMEQDESKLALHEITLGANFADATLLTLPNNVEGFSLLDNFKFGGNNLYMPTRQDNTYTIMKINLATKKIEDIPFDSAKENDEAELLMAASYRDSTHLTKDAYMYLSRRGVLYTFDINAVLQNKKELVPMKASTILTDWDQDNLYVYRQDEDDSYLETYDFEAHKQIEKVKLKTSYVSGEYIYDFKMNK